MDSIGHLNLFEMAHFTQCLQDKLDIPDVSLSYGAPAAAADADGEEVRMRNSCVSSCGNEKVCVISRMHSFWFLYW